MEAVKNQLADQVDLAGRINRVVVNLEKKGKLKITVGLIKSRMQQTKDHWAEFCANHKILVAKARESAEVRQTDYFSQDYFQSVEELYQDQMGTLIDMMAAYQELQEPSVDLPESNVVINHTHAARPRAVLPRIELPTFDGHFRDWMPFHDLFQSLILNDSSLTDVERLHYLKNQLKGDALQMLQNLPTTEGNFQRAWDLLKTRFENTRLLISSQLENLYQVAPMAKESEEEIKRVLYSTCDCVEALAALKRPVDSTSDWLVHLTVNRLDSQSRREWETSLGGDTDPPTFEKLKQFLESRLVTLAALDRGKGVAPKGNATGSRGMGKSSHSHQVSSNRTFREAQCPVCKKNHYLLHCKIFQEQTPTERNNSVKSAGLCWNCLGKHFLDKCRSPHRCQTCAGKHHSLLHGAELSSSLNSGPSASANNAVSFVAEPSAFVLLATAIAVASSERGEGQIVRAMIDSGSQVSLISEALTQRLSLKRKAAKVSIVGIGGRSSANTRGEVSFMMSPYFASTASVKVMAYVLPSLTSYASEQVSRKDIPAEFQDLALADPEIERQKPIDIVLGADIYPSLVKDGMRVNRGRTMVAQNTMFGWVVLGQTQEIEEQAATSLHALVETDLHHSLERFWKQEEILLETPLTPEEDWCEKHFSRTHTRNAHGRYSIRLPFRDREGLGGSRNLAMHLLNKMESQFQRRPQLKEAYTAFMDEYAQLEHMTRASKAEGPHFFLPHHGVMRESSSTTKLRVVFNGSQVTTSGKSLHDLLYPGPNLLADLPDILLRWCENFVAIGGDIEKMFRQIEVHPEDWEFQRIVWRSSAELPVQEYYLTTLTYGLVCSPFIANRTLRQLADDERSRFPLASQVLKNDTYVDDVLTGAATVEKAIELQRELRELCKAGGFSLRKWVSNSKEVLAAIGESGPMSSEAWKSADNTTLLGVRWSASTDAFHFEVNTTLVETPITKRKALSEIAKIFDPLGWLSPVTIWAKCFMQSLWLLKTSWDEPLASAEDKTWNKFREELPQLNRLSQPRWLGTSPTDEVELHGFADASERAYAAVAYLRIRDASGRVKISLLGAKTKVAPLKQVSLPRLELCAAMLLAQHVKKLLGALRTKPVSIHLWSDSTVTLGWIRGHPTKWKTYVANRVSQIQCLIPQALWHHVSGLENPADCASRGLMPSVLPSFSLWWEGPPFLKDEISYPELDIPSPQEEQRLQSHLASKQPSELPKNPLLCRFSSLTRLLRVSAWCLRWRSPTSPKIRSPSLSSEELQEVRLRWVRLEQELFFAKDLRELRRTQQLPATSKMSSLAPFLDAHGVLRVRGRLANSLLSYKEQHPFILPAESILTRLLVEEVHQRHLHSGTQLTLAALRQEAWILKGRQAVRSVLHKCTVCIRWRARAGTQLMADLPADRVQPGRPFSNVGVDYAGPIWVRAAKGRGQHAYKGYIAVFICLATRAMHLEAVSSADTASFLAALQRFLSRRGFSSRIYSDCGTNFVGADRELKELLAAAQLENSPLTSFCADRGIEWRFNPPGAPHFGGLWEAGVKSVKHHLRRIIGEQKLTFEELSTLLARIEACLNSRPLQALSDDPQDIAALTPGHFLVGSALTAVPEPSLEEVPISRLSRWQLVTQKQQHFWRRWSREYIATLQPRGKWRRMTATMKEGDLCLILNETLPPTRWPLARVTVLHKGRDGLPRVATLRTATGELTRPITKLVMLPAESGDAAASPPLKTGQCE